MKQMIKIIRKVDVEKQYAYMLSLEVDYELATLFDALQTGDEAQQEKSKQRLNEIHSELQGLKVYA